MKIFRFLFFTSVLFLSLTKAFAVDHEKSLIKNSESKRLVKGIVIDRQTGESLAGSSIVISTENNVQFSDFNGQFSFFASCNTESYLRIEAIGYQSKTILLRNFISSQQIELDSL